MSSMAGKATKNSVVLYPSPGMGHLVPMVELAKLLATRHDLSVTIIVLDPHYHHGSTSPFLSRLSLSHNISIHRLPPLPSPPPHNPSPHRMARAFDLIRLSLPHLLLFLRSLPPPSALILDLFTTLDARKIQSEFPTPIYFFFPSGAAHLSLFLHLPRLDRQTPVNLRRLGSAPLHLPGFPPLPADHLPADLLDGRGDSAYESSLSIARSSLPLASGFIANTFDALQLNILQSVSSAAGLPPLYCIGPIIREHDTDTSDHVLTHWLDSQPENSVIFLCFGSMGSFSSEQLQQIAIGLERSQKRFLWVVKSPPNSDPESRFSAPAEPDLDSLLPGGFLERTQERGLVVRSWAPQMAVLKHGSTGGFVSHCGWNSVLEAVSAGVPMIAWPLHAEQRMNKVFLVEEAKLAVAVEGYDKGVVSAEEVERKIRWLMESEGGRELRARSAKAKADAAAAMEEGGSSRAALTKLVSSWQPVL